MTNDSLLIVNEELGKINNNRVIKRIFEKNILTENEKYICDVFFINVGAI